jgi:hypothetical protein
MIQSRLSTTPIKKSSRFNHSTKIHQGKSQPITQSTSQKLESKNLRNSQTPIKCQGQ